MGIVFAMPVEADAFADLAKETVIGGLVCGRRR